MKNEGAKKYELSSDGRDRAWLREPVCPKTTAELTDEVMDLRHRAIVLLMMDKGLRASELAVLDLGSIEIEVRNLPDGRSETIGRGSVPIAESGKRREFVLSPRTAEAMRIYGNCPRCYDTSPALSTRKVGCHLLLRLTRIVVREWCDRLGNRWTQILAFRRSLARRLTHKGGNSPDLAKDLDQSKK